ncbi:MAG: SusC/RagA family TonB-linked outer membrane protein [Bacteroidales bacterium]|nr:SusC/RagA family TonB-linked outer membrane protein [Bacteroidales bacterium]
MKHNLLLFIFILCAFAGVSAQGFMVTGTVTSAEDGLGIPGVSVYVKSSFRGTTTDINGAYKLEGVDAGDTLVYQFLGYIQVFELVGARTNINVLLEPEAQKLEGVVVTALGIKREKREIGYTTQSFTGGELEKSNAQNVVTALSGKSAGVQVSEPDGIEGGTTRIVIRGNNNLTTGNQPLIVVDGVPIENDPGLTNIGRGQDWGSAINNINQADIDEISILKGPTASALYGSKGANGVVLISTKRGKKQAGIGVSYSYNYKIIDPYRYRDVQNKYGAGGPISLSEPVFMEDSSGTYIYPTSTHTNNGPFGKPTSELFGYYGTAASWGPEMNGQMVKWWDGEMRSWSPQPDNIKLYFGEGNTATHNISFSGGSEVGTIRVSMTRTDHTPIIPNSNYDQTTINLGSNVNISEKVKADIAVSYINYNRLNSPNIGESYSSFSKASLYSWPRSWKGLETLNYTNPDGTRNEWGGNYPFWYISPYNWWEFYNNNTTLARDKLIGSFGLSWEITPWLTATGRMGLDLTTDQKETRNNPADLIGILDGYYENELSRMKVVNNDFLITAHKDNLLNSKLNAKWSVGGTQYQRRYYRTKAQSGKWIDPWLFNSSNFENPEQITYDINNRREAWNDKDINSLYSFLNLGWDNYLYIEMTGRNDWSSTLPADNNSYFYPSLSMSFIPTEALKFKNSVLNFWKIKGSLATAATDTDPYTLDFVYYSGLFGNTQTSSLDPTIPPLELAPQRAKSHEIGTTIGMFNERLSLDFTYYHILSDNQILNLPVPASSGATGIVINNGELENKGYEIILNYVIVNTPKLVFETSLNYSRNRNYVISLGNSSEPLELGNIWDLNGPAIAVREGDEYGTIVGYDYVYHENGQPILSDDGTTYKITENRVPIGNASPKFIGGWSMRLLWKGFTLSTLIDTKWGGDIYCGSQVIGLQTGQAPETLLERDGGGLPYTDEDGETRNVGVILPGVYEDGTTNDKVVHYYFKYMPNAGGWGKFLSTPGIIENSWIKMREISLSYNIPASFIEKTKIFQSLAINLVGRNLFYIYTTLPNHINPEGLLGSGNAQGLEWASYPGTRSFSFGITASF